MKDKKGEVTLNFFENSIFSKFWKKKESPIEPESDKNKMHLEEEFPVEENWEDYDEYDEDDYDDDYDDEIFHEDEPTSGNSLYRHAVGGSSDSAFMDLMEFDDIGDEILFHEAIDDGDDFF